MDAKVVATSGQGGQAGGTRRLKLLLTVGVLMIGLGAQLVWAAGPAAAVAKYACTDKLVSCPKDSTACDYNGQAGKQVLNGRTVECWLNGTVVGGNDPGDTAIGGTASAD